MIHELILSPGDARLRLLEWLIVRYQKLIIMTYNSNTGNVYNRLFNYRVHPHLRSVVALTKHGETKLDSKFV